MNVLHFYRTCYPDTMGGVEQVIYQLARCAASRGVHTEVLALTGATNIDTIQLESHRVHRARTNFRIASVEVSLSAFRRFAIGWTMSLCWWSDTCPNSPRSITAGREKSRERLCGCYGSMGGLETFANYEISWNGWSSR